MKKTEKPTPATRARKAVSLTMSAVFAFSLSFGMLPLYAGAEEAETNPPAAEEVVPVTPPAPVTPTPEPEDLVALLGAEGAAAYDKWLKGLELTNDELLKIDVEALRPTHPEDADKIKALQDAAKQAEEASDDSTTDEGKTDGTDDGSESDSDAADDEATDESSAKEDADKKDKASKDDKSKKDDAAKDAKDAAAATAPKPAEEAPASDHPQWTYEGDTTFEPRNPNLNLTTTKLIAVIGEPARMIAGDNDLYASVMIAQAILESDSGNSETVKAPHFNLFGMEGTYEPGDEAAKAPEGGEAGSFKIGDVTYKSYPSLRESLEDYAKLMSGDEYEQAHKSNAESYEAACDFIEEAYADSSDYAESLKDLIEDYDLTRYDRPLDYALAKTYTVKATTVPADAEEGEEAVVEHNLVDLVSEASSHLGCPYVWGATGPDTFDCSGFVQRSYSQALGVLLPRTSYWQCTQGKDVNFRDLHMGDLLFFTNKKGEVNHVAMYLAEGCYIESTSPGGVQVTALDERTPTFAKRVLNTVPVDVEAFLKTFNAAQNAGKATLRNQPKESVIAIFSEAASIMCENVRKALVAE